MIELFGNIIGFFGAFLIVATFFAEQKHFISSKSFLFSSLNALGSLLIIAGMYISNTINYPSLILELAWLITALTTLYSLYQKK
jgi:hypothetical protein